MIEDIGFIGRSDERKKALQAVEHGQNVLLVGRSGIGRKALLHSLRGEFEGYVLPAGTNKNALLGLARTIHEDVGLTISISLLPARTQKRAQRGEAIVWEDLNHPLTRIPQIYEVLAASLEGKDKRIFIESLEVAPQQAEFFAQLLGVAQVIACMDTVNRRNRVMKMLYKFQYRLDLRQMSLNDASDIATAWTKAHGVRFANDKTQAAFVRHVAQDSGGIPAVMLAMMQSAKATGEITPATVREFQPENARRYFDMTPFLIIVMVVFMAMRYASRGLSEIEAYMLSGMGSALMFGMMFLLRQLGRRRN